MRARVVTSVCVVHLDHLQIYQGRRASVGERVCVREWVQVCALWTNDHLQIKTCPFRQMQRLVIDDARDDSVVRKSLTHLYVCVCVCV